MKKTLIIVVDYGTSNVRVNAIDTDNGDITYSASLKYLVEDKGKAYAEISAEHLWSFSEICMGNVMSQMKETDEIKAITFSFFGDNLIPVDKEGNALNDCILCTDSRGVREVDYINSRISQEEQIAIVGTPFMLFKFGAKLLWIKNHMPELADNIAYYDSQQQYIFRKLGIRPVIDTTMAARKQLCDISSGDWSERFLEVLGITRESLGEIVPTSEIVGYVEQYGSVQFENPIPVIAGGHDCDVAMIGMGLTDEDVDFVGDITGTFDHVGYIGRGIINIGKQRPDLPLQSYNGPLEDTSICLGAFPTAGATLEWFMREMNEGTGQEEYQKYWRNIQFDGKSQVKIYPALDNNRGKIEGIGVTTTKKDIFKAVIEALTFENRRLIEDCEKCKGAQIQSVRIGGGAAQSDEWMQLRADISGKNIERMRNIQISSVGSAALAAVKIGLYDSIEGAVEHMVHVQDTFTPNEAVHAKYEEAYQIYLKEMGYQ